MHRYKDDSCARRRLPRLLGVDPGDRLGEWTEGHATRAARAKGCVPCSSCLGGGDRVESENDEEDRSVLVILVILVTLVILVILGGDGVELRPPARAWSWT